MTTVSTAIANTTNTNIKMFNCLFENNRKISRKLQKLFNYYKFSNLNDIKRQLNEQTNRIIWQKNENCQLRKYLNELKFTPLEDEIKIRLLQTFHQKLVNLAEYTNITENEIESICAAIRNDTDDPTSLIDYTLCYENDEIYDINKISVELKLLSNLLENKILSPSHCLSFSSIDNQHDGDVKYLSDRVKKNVDFNNNLKAQLENVEAIIGNYEKNLIESNLYVSDVSEDSNGSVDLNDFDDDHKSILLIEDNESALNSSKSEEERSFGMNDFYTTKWELITYDVSNLLHTDIDMSVDEIRERFNKIVQTHRISEKLFCKAVLNTTSKVIKRLFGLKNTWDSMKAKDKIIMLRIYMWVNDPDGVKKLKDWTNQIKVSELDNENLGQPNECEDFAVINYDVQNLVLPNDITAEEVCNQFKKTIEKHGISQKLFAKAVLNVAQSTISKFLSKPRQYFDTNSLAKTTYLKMYAWLQDPKGFEKLQKWTEKWKWNEHTQNEIDILEEINRTKHENSIEYDTFDLSITKNITTREIRDRLKMDLDTNKISQKLFAKAVLNKAESTLSLLLTNPKTWETLNLRSKEKYLQIYKWLIDPDRLVKLDAWERKESEKKTRISKLYTKTSKSILTRQQEIYLTKSFQINMYPSKEQMKLIGIKLNLYLIKIINWFNHKRRKYNMQKRITNSINLNNKLNRLNQQIVNKKTEVVKVPQKLNENLDLELTCIKIENDDLGGRTKLD